MTRTMIAASVVVALAMSAPAFAQGRSQAHKKGTPAPPSRNDLAAPVVSVSSGGGPPLAWIDDATVLEPGGVSLAISALRWSGSGLDEVNFPVVDFALGLAPRVQLSASVPRVIGAADPNGAVGGLGTSYFSAKIAVLNSEKYAVKLAVSPTLEVLSPGVVEWLAPGEHRVQVGFPVSAEIDRGSLRLYGSAGYFTRGVWFTGAGAGVAVNDKVAVSAGFSRAWRRADVPGVPLGERDRNEISGGASYAVTPSVHVFGSIGRTIMTLEENGAGTTIGGGVAVFFTAPAK